MGTNDKDISKKPLDDLKAAIEQKELPEHEQEKLLGAHKSAPAIAAASSAKPAAAAVAATAAAAASAKAAAAPPTPPPTPPQEPKSHVGAAKGFWGAVVAAALIIGALFFVTSHHHREADRDAKTAYAANTDGDNSGFYAIKSSNATGADAAKAVQTAKDMQRMGAKALKGGEKAPVVVYLFNYDNSGVPESKVLNEAARRAKETDATVAVVAYTDEHGSDSYNMRLSQQRADAIARYMVAHGVPADHVKAKGLGETHAFGSDLQCRRAVLTFN